ncbi:MAG TPA: HD domain-containing protein [Syntrophomonas sp.]|nr:HD domain-containing protein [Syntrophomonas sp.]
MQKKDYDGFIARNGLRALNAAEMIPDESIRLALPALQSYIRDQGLNEGDFYINTANREKPFCYYRGTVLLEFAAGDLTGLKQAILDRENQLNRAVADRDFTRFFDLVDPRLAPDLFIDVFNFIPDQDKYPFFTRMLQRHPGYAEIFSPDFVRKATLYKDAQANMPLADERGQVVIFAGAEDVAGLKARTVWYTDINNAILDMLAVGDTGNIFRGEVSLGDIQSYAAGRSDKKVTLTPEQVADIKRLNMIKLAELPPLLQTRELIGPYFYFAEQIQTGLFHNPQGIHALSHTKRVLLLVLLLGDFEQLPVRDRDLICRAAVYHDIGRITDGYDTGHGIASYHKMEAKGLLEQVPAEERETIRFIIELHAVSDPAAHRQLNKYELDDVERTLKLYNLFKDADGLDRVRINDLNPEYLRSPGAHRLILLAHQLLRCPDFEKRLRAGR